MKKRLAVAVLLLCALAFTLGQSFQRKTDSRLMLEMLQFVEQAITLAREGSK